MNILAMLLAFLLQITGTGITYDKMAEKPFDIQFPKGAVEACTVYHSLHETIVQDGQTVPYEPKHCWFFPNQDLDRYRDDWAFINENGQDWDVHADVFYDVIEHGGNTVKMISTGTIRVRH